MENKQKITITEADILAMVHKAAKILMEDSQDADMSDKKSFNEAFGAARKLGLKRFVYKGRVYGTRLKGETTEEWNRKMDSIRNSQPLTPIANPIPNVVAKPQENDTLAPRRTTKPSEPVNTTPQPNKEGSVSGILDMYMTRVGFYGRTTISELRYTNAEGEERSFPVIEDVDRGLSLKFDRKINKSGKVWGETAIPEGVYNVKLHRHAGSGIISRVSSPAIKKAWTAAKGYPFLQIGEEHDNGVFTEVLMHQGTSERSSAGCLIIGGPGNAPSQRFSSKDTQEGICMLLNDTIPFKKGRITIMRRDEFIDFAQDEHNITASNRHINAFKQYQG